MQISLGKTEFVKNVTEKEFNNLNFQ